MVKKQLPLSRSPSDCGSSNRSSFHALSLSGGKDSTALLLLMLEKNMPIDAALWADTGVEFPELYDHIGKLDELLFRERGIHITVLRHPRGFEWMMLHEPKRRPSCLEHRAEMGIPPYGNGWPGIYKWAPTKSEILWGEEEQGSERSFRLQSADW